MYSILKERLQAYICENNPEVLVRLQGELSVTEFLEHKVKAVMPYVLELLAEDKPGPAIIELALDRMTESLRPSRYNYLKEVLATEFRQDYDRFKAVGVLNSECLLILEQSQEVFDAFDFDTDHQGSDKLRNAIIVKIHEHLN